MRKPSQVVAIDTVKRKVIKHKALSSPEEEVSQSLHCRSHPNRIDLFLSPLRSSRKVPCGKPSIHKSSSITSALVASIGELIEVMKPAAACTARFRGWRRS